MYLSNIKLWNFRKFGSDSELDISKPNLNLNLTKGLNVLIGENDSGKSAIIDAIKLVLKTHSYEWIKVGSEDFYNEALRFRIELRFDDLSDDEAKNFTEWLGWEGDGENAKPSLRLIYDVSRNQERILPSEVRAGLDEEGYQMNAEAREYLKVTYLKPLRDAKSELVPKQNSRLSQILQGHDAFKGEEKNHYLFKEFKNFNETITKYFEGKKPDGNDLDDKRGKDLKKEIDRYIKEFYDREKESNFGVVPEKLKNILEKLELTIKEEINPGLGTLNRLFMASELLHLNKINWSGLRLGLIEELEAHLHPQAQMQVIETLQNEKDIQLIVTTHSPNLGSKVKLGNLILCTANNAFPMKFGYTFLENETDYNFLERFLDTTKANLFFARGVIIVEGWSEEILLPSLAKKMKSLGIIESDLTETGVSIVNVGSTAFLRYSKIFLRKEGPFIDIPVAVITDLDLKPEEFESFKGISNINTKRKNRIITGFNAEEIERH
ncbi:MAG: AAA family ATPase, partial [Candidatus Lokiarchaeota archaeon]|nr:AAA family ATPase [Candidatus Lokiarchaeota archaeon]